MSLRFIVEQIRKKTVLGKTILYFTSKVFCSLFWMENKKTDEIVDAIYFVCILCFFFISYQWYCDWFFLSSSPSITLEKNTRVIECSWFVENGIFWWNIEHFSYSALYVESILNYHWMTCIEQFKWHCSDHFLVYGVFFYYFSLTICGDF